MVIGIVGGLDREAPRYERVASARGHEVLLHNGLIGGRGAKALETLIANSDLVVVATDINSHGSVHLTRRLLLERGKAPILLRKFGPSRLAALLDELPTASQKVRCTA